MSSTIEILPITEEKLAEVVAVTCEAMNVEEPLNYCAGITKTEFYDFLF